MSLLPLQANRCKEQSANSPNICHAGQYIIIKHKTHAMYTTHAVQHGNISSQTAALGLLNAVN